MRKCCHSKRSVGGVVHGCTGNGSEDEIYGRVKLNDRIDDCRASLFAMDGIYAENAGAIFSRNDSEVVIASDSAAILSHLAMTAPCFSNTILHEKIKRTFRGISRYWSQRYNVIYVPFT